MLRKFLVKNYKSCSGFHLSASGFLSGRMRPKKYKLAGGGNWNMDTIEVTERVDTNTTTSAV